MFQNISVTRPSCEIDDLPPSYEEIQKQGISDDFETCRSGCGQENPSIESHEPSSVVTSEDKIRTTPA